MTEHKSETATIHQVPKQPADNAITLRVPKPNMQVAILGIVAFITLFQTVQLVRISGSASSVPVRAAATTTSTGSTGTGSNASTPQSMVGGC